MRKRPPCIFEKKVKKKQQFQKNSGDYDGLFFGFFAFFAKKGPPGAEKTEKVFFCFLTLPQDGPSKNSEHQSAREKGGVFFWTKIT